MGTTTRTSVTIEVRKENHPQLKKLDADHFLTSKSIPVKHGYRESLHVTARGKCIVVDGVHRKEGIVAIQHYIIHYMSLEASTA